MRVCWPFFINHAFKYFALWKSSRELFVVVVILTRSERISSSQIWRQIVKPAWKIKKLPVNQTCNVKLSYTRGVAWPKFSVLLSGSSFEPRLIHGKTLTSINVDVRCWSKPQLETEAVPGRCSVQWGGKAIHRNSPWGTGTTKRGGKNSQISLLFSWYFQIFLTSSFSSQIALHQTFLAACHCPWLA